MSGFEVIHLLSEGGLQTLPGLNRVKGVDKIEATYGMSRVNVKAKPRSTFTFTSDLSNIASI